VAAFTISDVARCWAGLASLGAGLVSVAIAREQVGSSWAAFAVVLGVAGYQLAWALAALARPALPLPRLTVALNVVVATAWVLQPSGGLLSPVLELMVVATVLGAGAAGTAPARRVWRSAGGYLAAVGVGGLVVAAVATPAMAATEAGQHARPHGSHFSGR
jgi:hypothetical protein